MPRILEQKQISDTTLYTRFSDGVAMGLRRSDYINERGWNGGGRAVSPPIKTDDPKYDMYANALPSAIRQKVCEAGLDVRQLYKEYRKIGREAMVLKYQEI